MTPRPEDREGVLRGYDPLAPEEVAELRDEPMMVHLYDAHRLVALLLASEDRSRVEGLDRARLRLALSAFFTERGEYRGITHDKLADEYDRLARVEPDHTEGESRGG